MSTYVQYVTNEKGERVGVLLDIEAYQKLTNPLNLDTECLNGLTLDELEALANSKLATVSQARLDELLVKNAESQLLTHEAEELEKLIAQVDQLTILKTRALYTLHQLQRLSAAS